MKNVISVTSKALVQIKKILIDNNSKAITFGIKSGGCNGYEYDIKPTNDQLIKGDELYSKNGIDIHVCGKSVFYILGTEVDWKDDFMGACFVFNNPTASSACGCGTSFDVSDEKIF